MQQGKMTYAGSGVDYDAMDPFKRRMLEAALPTAANLARHGFEEVTESRGESAYVVDVGPFMLAFVEEGLGTKNKVAEAMAHLARSMRGLTGETFSDNIAQCNLAMQVNDLSTVGAAPFVSMLHTAAGTSGWFADEKRNDDIAVGHAAACDIAGCAWGGGESPTLRDIIFPGTAVFAGSSTGVINPKSNLLLGSRIRAGDVIIIIRSSGIHANGLTLCRDIEAILPKGYLTELPSGITYGEALLEPTVIYSPLINACAPLLHYAVNITGHGWRKLMRARQSFRYVINNVPMPQEIFTFIQRHGNVSDREAYGNLNMGAGYAFFASPEQEHGILRTAEALEFDAMTAGYVEEGEGRSVVIKPLDLEYNANELKVR
jgi:phosphoribosylformylglycinamidine cyclo-ligase